MGKAKKFMLYTFLITAVFAVIGCSSGNSGPKDMAWDREKWDESNWK